jgi:hypothetical protein
MPKKCIILGFSGEIILKKEILEHLKVKPGEELTYKLMPGNRLILESSINPPKSSNKEITSEGHFELTDLKNTEIKKYSASYQFERLHTLH